MTTRGAIGVLGAWGAVAVISVSALGAEMRGPISELPKDGAWAEYKLDLQRTQGGQTRSREASVKIASVGEESVDGMNARWVEFALQMGEEPPLRTKLLIPESAFEGNESPAAKAVRAWSQRGDEAPQPVQNPAEQIRRGPLETMLPGKLTDIEMLDEKTVEVKRAGNIVAKGRTGRVALTDRRGTDELVYRIWSSSEVPFRLVAAEIEEVSADRTADRTVKITLKDFGTGAKSQMPGAE